ncbi:hypothetical protein GMRT_11326 [Giardia muris]|uniref:Uncharacterized protein n=1 Tax=Giardia muris TaxID=5742 RepID=A0A4Z1SLS7_GIAMU|nr:hypothetical protein GMRT_11326 [Giardia muris]|eukprot:TNJ26622.1 hypothetical protein GMRT_11326 [Giardia muris]
MELVSHQVLEKKLQATLQACAQLQKEKAELGDELTRAQASREKLHTKYVGLQAEYARLVADISPDEKLREAQRDLEKRNHEIGVLKQKIVFLEKQKEVAQRDADHRFNTMRTRLTAERTAKLMTDAKRTLMASGPTDRTDTIMARTLLRTAEHPDDEDWDLLKLASERQDAAQYWEHECRKAQTRLREYEGRKARAATRSEAETERYLQGCHDSTGLMAALVQRLLAYLTDAVRLCPPLSRIEDPLTKLADEAKAVNDRIYADKQMRPETHAAVESLARNEDIHRALRPLCDYLIQSARDEGTSVIASPAPPRLSPPAYNAAASARIIPKDANIVQPPGLRGPSGTGTEPKVASAPDERMRDSYASRDAYFEKERAPQHHHRQSSHIADDSIGAINLSRVSNAPEGDQRVGKSKHASRYEDSAFVQCDDKRRRHKHRQRRRHRSASTSSSYSLSANSSYSDSESGSSVDVSSRDRRRHESSRHSKTRSERSHTHRTSSHRSHRDSSVRQDQPSERSRYSQYEASTNAGSSVPPPLPPPTLGDNVMQRPPSVPILASPKSSDADSGYGHSSRRPPSAEYAEPGPNFNGQQSASQSARSEGRAAPVTKNPATKPAAPAVPPRAAPSECSQPASSLTHSRSQTRSGVGSSTPQPQSHSHSQSQSLQQSTTPPTRKTPPSLPSPLTPPGADTSIPCLPTPDESLSGLDGTSQKPPIPGSSTPGQCSAPPPPPDMAASAPPANQSGIGVGASGTLGISMTSTISALTPASSIGGPDDSVEVSASMRPRPERTPGTVPAQARMPATTTSTMSTTSMTVTTAAAAATTTGATGTTGTTTGPTRRNPPARPEVGTERAPVAGRTPTQKKLSVSETAAKYQRPSVGSTGSFRGSQSGPERSFTHVSVPVDNLTGRIPDDSAYTNSALSSLAGASPSPPPSGSVVQLTSSSRRYTGPGRARAADVQPGALLTSEDRGSIPGRRGDAEWTGAAVKDPTMA